MRTNFRDRVLELAEEATEQRRESVASALYFVASTMSVDQTGEQSSLNDLLDQRDYQSGSAIGIGMAIDLHRKAARSHR